MLSGANVTLRAIEETDLDQIAAWRGDPAVYQGLIEQAPLSRSRQHRWYEGIAAQEKERTAFWFVICSRDGQPIGVISLTCIDWRCSHAEFGLYIGEALFRGKGLGREALSLLLTFAFHHLGLHRIYCRVLEGNQPALALYRRLDFQEEGRMREHVFLNGRHSDLLLMGLLAREFKPS